MLAAGVAREELQVERVVLRIQANQEEPPHGATADFDLVRLENAVETDRERWTLSLQFIFLETIPPRNDGFQSHGNHHHLSARRPGFGYRRVAMIEHLHDREKSLEPFGWRGREAEWDRPGLSP